MKASSIIDNVINLKHDVLKVNKNSDKNFDNCINTKINNQENANNPKLEFKTENNYDDKTIFKKIENIKEKKIKEKNNEEILSEKLPKKIEQIINFIALNELNNIPKEKIIELKELLQNLLSKIRELKPEDKINVKEDIIKDLKKINLKLKELFPEKEIKINLIKLKENYVIDLEVSNKNILIQKDDKNLKIFKYKKNEKVENKNQKIIKSNSENKESIKEINDKKNIFENEKKLLSLIYEEKIKNKNITDKTSDVKDLSNSKNININDLMAIKDFADKSLKQQHINKINEKNNYSKIKLSQMLANKNYFLKISKDISYFDLNNRTKIFSKNIAEKNTIEDKIGKNNNKNNFSKEEFNYKPKENINYEETKENFIEKRNNKDFDKVDNKDKSNKKIDNNISKTTEPKKQNIEINTILNNKINGQNNNNLSINKTTFNQPIHLRNFNSQITDIINQKSTENTFREIVTVKVNPPNLGNVDVEIMKSGKTISISVLTENENAKNIITRTIQSLIGSLRDQGFNPVNVKVETPPETDFMDTEKQNQQNNEHEQHTEDNNEEKEFENILRGEENV